MIARVKLNKPSRLLFSDNMTVTGDVWRCSREGPVGVVKMLEPVSPLNNYYEIKILNKGKKTAIGIGVGTMSYSMSAMPGWNSQCIGYHADDAKVFHENGMGKNVGAPTCTEGDVMGCGVLFDVEEGPNFVRIFFTKNGKFVGERIKMKRPLYGLYPIVGTHSLDEAVEYLGHSVCTNLEDIEDDVMAVDNSPRDCWLRCNAVRFLHGGLVLEYYGIGQAQGQDVGIAQSLYPLTRSNHYFEMKIDNAGKSGWLAIGLGVNTYPLNRHPGWNSGGIGYHADNGQLYEQKGQGVDFGPTCGGGDTMGCGIRFADDNSSEFSSEESEDEDWVQTSAPASDHYDDFFYGGNNQPKVFMSCKKNSAGKNCMSGKEVTVFFTKNGAKVGETKAKVPKGGFYPLVAMLSAGERVTVDFNPLTG